MKLLVVDAGLPSSAEPKLNPWLRGVANPLDVALLRSSVGLVSDNCRPGLLMSYSEKPPKLISRLSVSVGMLLTKVMMSATDLMNDTSTLPNCAAMSSRVIGPARSEITGIGAVRMSTIGWIGLVMSCTVPSTGLMKSLMKVPRSRLMSWNSTTFRPSRTASPRSLKSTY